MFDANSTPVDVDRAESWRGTGGGTAPELLDLYRAHRERIMRLCTCMLGNAEDAEDATQETFLRAARVLHQLTGDAPTFLRVIARNVCRDEIRRRRMRSDNDVPETAAAETAMETSVMHEAELLSVWRKLRQDDRTLLAHSFAGYSYEEISRRTGWSLKTVSVGLVRARQRARMFAGPALTGTGALLGWLARSARNGAPRRTVALQPAAVCMGAFMTTAIIGGLGASPGVAEPALSNAKPAVVSERSPLSPLQHAARAPASALGGQPRAVAAPPVSDAVAQGSPRTGHGHTVTTGSIVTSLVNPTQNARPEDTGFHSITPSPSYTSDRTVFAGGDLITGCPSARPCPVLFRTTDGGRSWTNLGSDGYLGGTVLLPPSYPVDPTIFVSGPAGLQRSDDGGATFTIAVPGPAPMAVDPDSPSGDTHILIGSLPALVYHGGSRTVTPGPTLPATTVGVYGVAYAGRSEDVLLAVAEASSQVTGGDDGAVLLCALSGSCRETLRRPAEQMSQVLASPTFGQDRTAVAVSATGVWVSRDGGRSFARGADADGTALAVSLDPQFAANGTMLAAATSPDRSGAIVPTIFVSVNRGESFMKLPSTGLAGIHRLVEAAVILGDGHVLAALGDSDDGVFGLRCAPRLGAAWVPAC